MTVFGNLKNLKRLNSQFIFIVFFGLFSNTKLLAEDPTISKEDKDKLIEASIRIKSYTTSNGEDTFSDAVNYNSTANSFLKDSNNISKSQNLVETISKIKQYANSLPDPTSLTSVKLQTSAQPDAKPITPPVQATATPAAPAAPTPLIAAPVPTPLPTLPPAPVPSTTPPAAATNPWGGPPPSMMLGIGAPPITPPAPVPSTTPPAAAPSLATTPGLPPLAVNNSPALLPLQRLTPLVRKE